MDDSGNRSTRGTLTQSNVDPACSTNCSIRTTMRLEWNLVSVPLQGPLSPTAIFGPLDALTDPCGAADLPCLYKWSSYGLTEFDGTYDLMDPDPSCPSPLANCVNQGEGYFFYTFGVTPLTASGTDVAGVTDGHLSGALHEHVPLAQGWNIIGNPFNSDVALATVHVLKLGATCSPSTADQELSFGAAVDPDSNPITIDGWVGNSIYVSTTSDGGTTVPAFYGDAVLQPWQGYWLQVLKNDCSYELLIPKP